MLPINRFLLLLLVAVITAILVGREALPNPDPKRPVYCTIATGSGVYYDINEATVKVSSLQKTITFTVNDLRVVSNDYSLRCGAQRLNRM